MDSTICVVHFKSLTLANLDAALFSVRRQNFDTVRELVVLDNDTPDSVQAIDDTIRRYGFPVPVTLVSCKHGDASKTHAWSTNTAVSLVRTPWIVFTRADYILRDDAVSYFTSRADGDKFITGSARHLTANISACELAGWRHNMRVLDTPPGAVVDYAAIDSGVWMLRKNTFIRAGGLDERLTAWGHAQTEFQHRLHLSGVTFDVIPQVLFYHPQHGAPRDIEQAHSQLRAIGVDISKLWDRHTGPNPYAGVK